MQGGSMTSYNEIVKIANKQKKNVEANNELAHSYKWAYYFAYTILKPKQSIKSIKFNKAIKPSGHDFKAKVPIEFVLKWGKALIKYVQKNKRMPSYAVWGNIHIAPEVYCYMYARAVVYYAQNGKLPKTVYVDTSLFKKKTKHGHATKHGCDNMGQNNGYYCGCHSIQEVLRNLTGIVVSQSTIASVAGTTSDGTCHDGLNTAIAWFNRKYGYNLTVEWKNFSDLNWNGIKKIMESNNQDCIIHNLYRNQWGHYETINKVLDDNTYVQNSLGNHCDDGCYCGYVEDRSKSEFRSYISGISQKSIMIITNR